MATTSAASALSAAAAAPAFRRRRAATASVLLPGRRAARALRCRAGPDSLGIPAKLAQLWEAARGASPAAVLAAAAAAAVVFKVAADLLAPPPPPPPRRRPEEPVAAAPEPVQVGEITEEELRGYDGSDAEKPLLMAIKGQIYDVSQSRMFYGPGGPYALFAGKDASRALAKMSFETQDLTADISGLGPFELSALQDWEYKFSSKYMKVGTIKKRALIEQGDGSSSSAVQNEATVVEEKSP